MVVRVRVSEGVPELEPELEGLLADDAVDVEEREIVEDGVSDCEAPLLGVGVELCDEVRDMVEEAVAAPGVGVPERVAEGVAKAPPMVPEPDRVRVAEGVAEGVPERVWVGLTVWVSIVQAYENNRKRTFRMDIRSKSAATVQVTRKKNDAPLGDQSYPIDTTSNDT